VYLGLPSSPHLRRRQRQGWPSWPRATAARTSPGPPAPLHLPRRRRHPPMSWIQCRWPMIT